MDRVAGTLTWLNPAGPSFKTPDDQTSYTISYRFRLDEPLKTVVQQIKPAHRSVMIKFADTDIQPWFAETFEGYSLSDLATQGPWTQTIGAANALTVTATTPLVDAQSGQYNITGPAFTYRASLPSRQNHHDVTWKWKFDAVSSGGTDEVSVVIRDGATLRWRVDMQTGATLTSGAIVLRDGAGGTFTLSSLDTTTLMKDLRVVVTPDNVVKVFLDADEILSGSTGANSFGDRIELAHFVGGGTNTAKIDNIRARFKYPTATLPIAIEV
jgi:hypothetical protein